MTVHEISDLIIRQIDDDPTNPVSVAPPTSGPNTTPPEVLAAINEGQNLAAWLTLCLEKTADFPLNGNCFYQPRPVLTDFLVPLRLTLGGARLRPATLAELESENVRWQSTAATPKRYACLGFNLLIVTPQGTGTAKMTYASSPVPLVNDADVPQLPEPYHCNLIDYGVYRVRLKEGAQGLARGLARLNLFLDDMAALGSYIRSRSVAARYDVEPFELALFDRSRLIDEVLKWQAKSTRSK